ncbi:hypothetical protein [Streptomyces sp. DH12]|uniref:hypothetical protein n=1 Tax=Streptomyces sp. DH12 TaxID=2857010 RepID=UPI001E415C4B|nr:hypothetical protein [Streptomyces sp. DH12]
MIKKALACAALAAAAMAIGAAPAAAGEYDDNGGRFHAAEFSAMEGHYLQSQGGAVIASGGAVEGAYMTVE